MPRHKSARTTRLDLKMISAPLGDFRHTMHIGRGGDAFGDTSFLSNHGPSSPNANSEEPVPTEDNNHDAVPGLEDGDTYELRHSDSVSSFDLDLDLGPSILGDVLGVMDGLALGSDWTHGQDAFIPGNGAMDVISQQGSEDWTGMESVSKETGHSHEHLYEVDGIKSKGLRPKVRFSEKQDEIIGRQDAIERLEVNGKEVTSPSRGIRDFIAKKAEVNNQKVDESPSSSSSLSSECDKKDLHHSESDSEDGTNGDQGYVFDEDSDDEIGL